MNEQYVQVFHLVAGATVALLVIASVCMIASRNLIRILIGVEVMSKAVTLALAGGGWLSGRTSLAQALIVTLILVEVVVIAVAAGVVIAAHGRNKSLDVRELRRLKG